MGIETTRDEPSRRGRRLPIVVLLGVALAAAAWTAIWATARSRILDEIDARLAVAAGRGVVVTCSDRSIGGYPFRLELACRTPVVEIAARGVRISAVGLRVVAQVWDPRLILLEVDGPGVGRDATGEVAGLWRSLRASLRWTTAGVDRLSIAAEDLDLTVKQGENLPLRLVAGTAQAHGRPGAAAGRDLDVALSFAAAGLSRGGRRIGPAAADLSVSASLIDFLPPGPGALLPAFATRGGRIESIVLASASGGVAIDGTGGLTLDRGGLLTGTVTATARGLDTLAGGSGSLGPELTTALSGFLLFGRPSSDPARPGRQLDLVLDAGAARIGRLSLGRLPPLFPPVE